MPPKSRNKSPSRTRRTPIGGSQLVTRTHYDRVSEDDDDDYEFYIDLSVNPDNLNRTSKKLLKSSFLINYFCFIFVLYLFCICFVCFNFFNFNFLIFFRFIESVKKPQEAPLFDEHDRIASFFFRPHTVKLK